MRLCYFLRTFQQTRQVTNVFFPFILLFATSCREEQGLEKRGSTPEESQEIENVPAESLVSRIAEAQKSSENESEEFAHISEFYFAATRALERRDFEVYISLRDNFKPSRYDTSSPLAVETRTTLDTRYFKESFRFIQESRLQLERLAEDFSSALANGGTIDLIPFYEQLDHLGMQSEFIGPMGTDVVNAFEREHSGFSNLLKSFDELQTAVAQGGRYDIRRAIRSLANQSMAPRIFDYEAFEAMEPANDFGVSTMVTPPSTIPQIVETRISFDDWKRTSPPAAIEFISDLDNTVTLYEDMAQSVKEERWKTAQDQLFDARRSQKKEYSQLFEQLYARSKYEIAKARSAKVLDQSIDPGEDPEAMLLKAAKSQVESQNFEKASELLEILSEFPSEETDRNWIKMEIRALTALESAMKFKTAKDGPATLFYLRVALRDSTSELLEEEWILAEIKTLTTQFPELLERPFYEGSRGMNATIDFLRRELQELQIEVPSLKAELRALQSRLR